ncbi:MAG: ABC transporter ATP-binding protein [Aquamicrobium sp.]|uniref:ABC transporter ATP-binding protein n=1 Tax=Aquamicrobium sp. TaxID=1872579 RepID=UPI00349E518F|nr:ABC transporter ATP-binding protein [Aquamicrobium sp.]
MQHLKVDNVSHWFGDFQALDSISLDVESSELIALLGPSGCGKTTLLRMIAGFIPTRSGRILLGGKDISENPPYKRNTGMVFQSYALFPHMTVFGNIAFGLEMRDVGKPEIERRVAEVLRLVRLDAMGERYPKQLSGGQQQRVAIARALVVQPDAFLLDEPLSNLDAKLRYSVGQEIRALQQELGLTTVFVTHDQNEALALADRLVVMDRGRIVQSGSAQELYARPVNTFVASFLGHAKLLSGKVAGEGRFSGRGFEVACDTRPFAVGSEQKLCLRAEQIALSAGDGANSLVGKVTSATYLGATTEVVLQVDGMDQAITVHHQNQDGATRVPKIGDTLPFSWRPENGILVSGA